MSELSSDVDPLLARACGHATRYRQQAALLPATPASSYEDMVASLSEPLPALGADGEAVIDLLAAKAEPGLHAVTGARNFGWVVGGSHPVGVAADWMAGAWGQNAANHRATPAAAAFEAVAAGWLLEILHLPRRSSVGFVTGSAMANFVCLAAARGEVLRRRDWDVEAEGLHGAPPVTVLVGADAHTTVFAALQLLGFGRNQTVRVPTDAQGRILVAAFAEALGNAAGPVIAVLQAGQINTGAFDDFGRLIPLARDAGAWVHVDGAFGLWARACPDKKFLTRGIDTADSWATDGHKWLQTPYDCGYAVVRDEQAHRLAMASVASYLPPAQGGKRDPSHYVPELSRRARGFASWAMIKHLGRAGIASMIARHCRVAAAMAERLAAEEGLAVLNDVELNQVIVRFGVDRSSAAADRLTEATVARVQAEGMCFVGGAAWHGRPIMRISVIAWGIDEAAGEAAADAIVSAWRKVSGAPSLPAALDLPQESGERPHGG